WEQEDPNNVYKVPVKAPKLDRRMIFRGKPGLPGHHYQDDHHPRPDNHMQSVEAGHCEIEAEENLGLVRISALDAEVQPRNQMMFEFLRIFNRLDPEENKAKDHRRAQKDNQPFPIALLGVVDGGSHREAAANQNQRIDEAELDVELVACNRKDVLICQPVNRICRKQPAEKQDFGRQEHPHAERTGLTLLLRIIELMYEGGRVIA